ncbi:MAG: proline dehydrogenase family protein [Terriglobia bacterium]|jgi:proline dehydrogenase
MLRSILLYLSEKQTPKKILTGHALGRRMAARFIAGEELEDALRVIRRLNAEGFMVTLDLLGESVQQAAEAEAACQAYVHILDRLAVEGLNSHVSVKLTQLGLAMDEGLACRQLRLICECAAKYHNFVRVDMEGSAFTEATLRVFRTVSAPRHVAGIVIQSYLYRSDKDVEELLKSGARIRLVKGAYDEPREIAYPRKRDVDRSFVRLMEMMLSSGIYHAIATHDERLIAAAQEYARAHDISPDDYEFQLLYGIRRHLQRDLLRQGARVRLYVPYGRQWYAYFMRRLAERPANLLFLLRNLFRA